MLGGNSGCEEAWAGTAATMTASYSCSGQHTSSANLHKVWRDGMPGQQPHANPCAQLSYRRYQRRCATPPPIGRQAWQAAPPAAARWPPAWTVLAC